MILIVLCAVAFVACIIVIKGYINLLQAYIKSGGSCYVHPLFHTAILLGAIVFSKDTEEAMRRIQMLAKNYPSGLFLGKYIIPTYFFYHPDHAKFILNHSHALDKGLLTKFGEGSINNGLVSAPVPIWRPHRKILQNIIKLLDASAVARVFNKHSLQLVERLVEYSDGRDFNVTNVAVPSIIGAIFEHVYGVEISEEDKLRYTHASECAGQIVIRRMYQLWLRFNFTFNLTTSARLYKKYTSMINDFTRDTITSRRQVSTSTCQSNGNIAKTRTSILDYMLESEYQFSDEELRGHLVTFTLAGFDTSGHAFAFALFMLANYPTVQEKVYEEVHGIYGTSDPKDVPVSAEDFPKMEYIDRVIKETMRFFTPIGIAVRRATQSITMGEQHIPKGSDIFVLLQHMHRREEYWPKALEFEPDRFLPDHPLGPRHRFAFAPFSSGPRNCIGAKYAVFSLKTALATVTRKYIFKTRHPQRAGDVRTTNSIATIPWDPLPVYIERRDTSF